MVNLKFPHSDIMDHKIDDYEFDTIITKQTYIKKATKKYIIQKAINIHNFNIKF